MAQLILYPPLVKLVNFPAYKQEIGSVFRVRNSAASSDMTSFGAFTVIG